MYILIWLVNISLSFYPITLQRELSNWKTHFFQGRTQWCQQITVQEHIFGEFALVHLTFGLCTSPTDTFCFTYHPFNVPGMYAVDNFQRLIFGNSQLSKKFTGKPKIVSLPTSSRESVKHKSTFTFTLTLRTIYDFNGIDQYLERCWPANDNYTIIAEFFSIRRTTFQNWWSKIDCNKSIPKNGRSALLRNYRQRFPSLVHQKTTRLSPEMPSLPWCYSDLKSTRCGIRIRRNRSSLGMASLPLWCNIKRGENCRNWLIKNRRPWHQHRQGRLCF